MPSTSALFADSHWQACYDSFLQHMYDKSSSERTRHHYRALLIRFFTDVAKPPERVLRGDVERFLLSPCRSTRNNGGPPAPATRNNRLGVLVSFYAFASSYLIEASESHVAPLFRGYSPTTGLSFVKAPQRPRALSENEIAALFAAIPAGTVIGLRDRAIFLFYLYTARRRAEIARLMWSDLSYGPIPHGDGSAHSGWLYRFVAKGSGGTPDIAELPQPAYDALHRYLEASDRLATMTPTSPLFVAIGPACGGGMPRDATSPLSSCTIALALKRYALAAGLDPKRVSLHILRHASAQHRYQAGQDVVAISHVLRHKNLATTHTYLQGLCGTADSGAAKLAATFARLS